MCIKKQILKDKFLTFRLRKIFCRNWKTTVTERDLTSLNAQDEVTLLPRRCGQNSESCLLYLPKITGTLCEKILQKPACSNRNVDLTIPAKSTRIAVCH